MSYDLSSDPRFANLSGPKVMLVGPSGSGKTYSIRSLVDAGIEVFAIFTEPGFVSVVGDIPSDKLKWKYIAPASSSWDAMLQSAQKINQLSFEGLTKLGGVNKQEHSQFLDFIATCNNFVDDRTGESFGDVSTWGANRALFVDSLSGLNIMAMNLVVGSKPVKAPGEWAVAMDNLERVVQKLCMDLRAILVLTAHLERELDEVSGGVQLMASTLGRKLAPKIPRYFDDVVHCVRDGTEWRWSTASLNVDLKARNLQWSDKIQPSFAPLLQSWRVKAGLDPVTGEPLADRPSAETAKP